MAKTTTKSKPSSKPKHNINDFKDRMTSPVGFAVITKSKKKGK